MSAITQTNDTTAATPKIGERRYKLKSTRASSAKYGNCEVCDKHCAEVFYQSVEQFGEFGNDSGWVYLGETFGHEACLTGLRPTQEEAVAQ